MNTRLARMVAALAILASLAPIYSEASVFSSKSARPGKSPRTVFVQLFEWPWKDIARECELYLGPNGFSAVQVSPPTEHMVWDGSPWWERYQPVSYQLLSRGGNEAEFRDMVSRCAAVGVGTYVDVIMNHMAGIDEGHGHAGTVFTHYDYPDLYSYQDFHHCGRNGNDDIRDFTDLFELLHCELVNLADLDTSSPRVQGKLGTYLNRLLEMGVEGFRIDAAKHMTPSDLRGILARMNRPAYILQELILSPGEPVDPREYLALGDINLFSYPYTVGEAFATGRLDRLRGVGKGSAYPKSDDAVVFLENHDLQRNPDPRLLGFQRDAERYALAQVFLLTWPYGYPQLFSSYRFDHFDQSPPVDGNRMTLPILNSDGSRCMDRWLCEHRLPGVAELVRFRNVTDRNFYVTDWWSNGRGQIAFGRGSAGFVAINSENRTLDRVFSSSLPAGTYCNIASSALTSDKNPRRAGCPESQQVLVDRRGALRFALPPRSALVLIHPELR